MWFWLLKKVQPANRVHLIKSTKLINKSNSKRTLSQGATAFHFLTINCLFSNNLKSV